MAENIQLLDCTLRDGAYIVDSNFGKDAICGIINRLQNANIDIIECGWLKDKEHIFGTSFFHIPSDLEQYLSTKNPNSLYVAMIDWDRYNLETLPDYDGKSIDAIRIVFPHGHFKEGIALGKIIKEKGYKVYFQAANTLAYSDDDLKALATEVNAMNPEAISVVDTFGAMYPEDLERIVTTLDELIDKNIAIGLHSHNNQQLSFSLSIEFEKLFRNSGRKIIIDASLCGMGRGAGNATTELVASYLNKKCNGNYDMNAILDAIDMYMEDFKKNYSWGYSTPYFIAGMYCTHVNNIAYLLNHHRTTAKDMRSVLDSLSPDDRVKYDYDLLEQKYLENQSRIVDDVAAITNLSKEIEGKEILLVLPGKSASTEKEKILEYAKKNNCIVIGVNAILDDYNYDYVFFCRNMRYEYAKDSRGKDFTQYKKIITSNIKTTADSDEVIVNFNDLVKRGWEHFDNAGIVCLRLLNRLHVSKVAFAGFDGFGGDYDSSYSDSSLPKINPGKSWEDLNAEIKEMLDDFRRSTENKIEIKFVTKSKYEE